MHREFVSSDLVSLLRDLGGAVRPGSRQDTAERLSQWMSGFDAVQLHGVHESIRTLAAAPVRLGATVLAGVEQDVRRTRAGMADAIAAFGIGVDSVPLPAVAAAAGDGKKRAAERFARYRLRYLAQQREMAHQAGALRARVRQVLARGSGPLRQLAALDAVWERLLAAREHKLLAQLPAWLKPQLLALPLPCASEPPIAVDGLRALLQAELNLRLHPVEGLLAAFQREVQAP